MQGYKLTLPQANSLMGQQYSEDCYFNPVKDINGFYFIFSGEVEDCNNVDFMWVKDLTLSNYVPPLIAEPK